MYLEPRIARALDRRFGNLLSRGAEISEKFARPYVEELLDPDLAVFVEDDVEIHVLEKLRMFVADPETSWLHRNEWLAGKPWHQSPNPRLPILTMVSTNMGTSVYHIPDPSEDPSWYAHLDDYVA